MSKCQVKSIHLQAIICVAIKGAYVYLRLLLVDFEEVYLFCLVTKFNDLNEYECAHKWGTFYLGIARRIEP